MVIILLISIFLVIPKFSLAQTCSSNAQCPASAKCLQGTCYEKTDLIIDNSKQCLNGDTDCKKNNQQGTCIESTSYGSYGSYKEYFCYYIIKKCGSATCETGQECLENNKCFTKIEDAKTEEACKAAGKSQPTYKFIGNVCYLADNALTEYKKTPTIAGQKTYTEIKPPTLSIKIPQLAFSQIKDLMTQEDDGTYLQIPWIGQYLKAVYNFSLGIVSMVAVIMIILAGVQIITSGGGERKTAAYKKILQIFIGLAIAWGSYAILYNINPSLVQFKALKVKWIEPENMPQFEELQTATGDTSGGETDVGSYTPVFSNCPITLSEGFSPSGHPEKEARTMAFYSNINSAIKGTTTAEKIKQIADAAIKCNIHLGSCGRTVGTIYTLAGVTTKNFSSSCLSTTKGCWTHEQSKNLYSVPSSIIGSLKKEYNCDTCASSKDEALKKVQAAIKAKGIQGWPDAWANQLKPGDSFWIYNANSRGKGSGLHAALFVGWASDGVAQVIQGTAGQRVKFGTTCIKSSCGDKMKSLIKIFRPKE